MKAVSLRLKAIKSKSLYKPSLSNQINDDFTNLADGFNSICFFIPILSSLLNSNMQMMSNSVFNSTLISQLKNCDVIYYDFLQSQVILKNQNHKYAIARSSLNLFFNRCAQSFGHSLNGQKEAYKTLMHAKKWIPILVSQNPLLLFMPLKQKDLTIYINYSRLEYHPQQKKRSTLSFVDDFQLEGLQTIQVERNYLNAKWYLKKIYSSQSSQ